MRLTRRIRRIGRIRKLPRVSPRTVRRYRAERLLQREFEALRGKVLAAARARLRSSGVTLDASDLEACYATAWQGLYMATLDGEEIEDTVAWLVLVTFRRAIEEHRARGRRQRLQEQMRTEVVCASEAPGRDRGAGGDLAAELDDRMQLRQLLEGIRGRLSAREREAAVLCYLQGFSRAQAAARMGVSEKRMRKLMEGAGSDRPGVAGKVGALVDSIRAGQWCDEQGSLMRALAYGVLDPEGERYKLALAHRDECPACRAYVLSLRGLAVTLPPVFLPWGLGAAALARDGARVGAVGARAGTGTGTLAGGAAGTGAGVGAAGGGAAGGGWLFAGGAKLAAGCVLALSVGAGCAALDIGASHPRPPAHGHRAHAAGAGGGVARSSTLNLAQADTAALGQPTPGRGAAASTAALTPAARVSREFGPEQALAGTSPATAASSRAATAHAASATEGAASSGEEGGAGSTGAAGATASSSAPAQAAGATSAAEREFSPG